jgi:hypothetical protein
MRAQEFTCLSTRAQSKLMLGCIASARRMGTKAKMKMKGGS